MSALLRSGLALLLCAASPARADDARADDARPDDDRGAYLHLGAGALLFSEGAVIRSGGAVIPQATIRIAANETLIVEGGYRWRHWGVSVTGGFPPVATVDGAGSLGALGSLGRIRYGPVVTSGLYQVTGLGRLHPYVGGGPVFLLIFSNKDDAVRHLDVRSSLGIAAQGGTTFDLTRRWGLFADVKKGRLRTHATALLGDTPITAQIRLDPLVLSGGLSYRF